MEREHFRIVGESAWARGIRGDIRVVSRFPATVLISGPTGTGKELIARSIHAHSRRTDGPFVAIDCAAITGTLFASQLFGHVKGAFTGAHHSALGGFRAADGGTIFLDELGELQLDLQVKLLRTLQERVVVPLGSLQEYPVDVRVLAATNRDLSIEVCEGRFREDLLYRLNVVTLEATPLRARPVDIEPLAKSFLGRLEIRHGIAQKAISTAALDLLRHYDWPGNVRELENVLERATLYSDGDSIEAEHLSYRIRQRREDSPRMLPTRPAPGSVPHACADQTDNGHWLTMEEVSRRHLLATLAETNYNQTVAARLLAMDRNQLRRRALKYGIDLSPSRPGRPAR